MSENGFFRYAGKLESLPCLVEDHVYDNINLESGNQMVSAGLNNLFGEVMWFYPTTGSSVVNRQVTYNYFDSSPQRPVWTVGTLARTMWEDSAIFGKPCFGIRCQAQIHLLMWWATLKVEQHTMNTKQGLIKLRVELLRLSLQILIWRF